MNFASLQRTNANESVPLIFVRVSASRLESIQLLPSGLCEEKIWTK